MKTRNKFLSVFLTFSLIFALLLPIFSPITAAAESEVVLIECRDDFIEFAKNCSYDLYSRGKSFMLTSDIDLEGSSFASVPVFSGSFDGGGHTISGLDLTEAGSPMGLFSILDKGGTIKNLAVVGTVSPEGDAINVGGIVGENRGTIEHSSFLGSIVGSQNVGGIAGVNALSGSIKGCVFSGEILGEEAVGGIAGRNEGLIFSSENLAKVNTIAITPTLSLEDINLSLSLDITRLPTLGGVTLTDLGGISGYSTGIILDSRNGGRVGYPHVGYNVGGIAGRSSGHINGCINDGEIFGRKDVGGIVGHMEPHVDYELSEDLLKNLKSELDRLSGKVNDAIGTADSGIPNISTRLDSIITNIDSATDSLDKILTDMGEYGEDMTGEINRLGAILSEVISQISSVTKELPGLGEELSSGLTDLENALDDLDAIVVIGISSLPTLSEFANDLGAALESISLAFDNLSVGLDLLNEAIKIEDQAKAEAAITDITDGLFSIVSALDGLNAKIGDTIDAFGNNAWIEDAMDEAEKLATSLGKSADAITDIYEATLLIKDNISLNWSEFITAGEKMTEAIDYVSTAMTKMNEAMILMESSMIKITDGIDLLMRSVSIKDGDATKDATKLLIEGIDGLVKAIGSGAGALDDLADAMSNLGGADPDSELQKIADSIVELGKVGGEGADAFGKLAEGLKVVSENLELNVDDMTDGGSLVIGGAKDMSDALGKMRDGISNMNLGMKAVNEAMGALSGAVAVGDEAKIAEALDSLTEAIGELAYAAGEITDVLQNTVGIMREAKLWGDDLITSLSNVSDAAGEITTSILSLKDGVDALRENLTLDVNSVKEGAGKITAALSDMSDAAAHLRDAILHIDDILEIVEGAGESLSSMVENLSSAVEKFSDTMKTLAGISEDIHRTVKYLMGVDPIQLPTPPDGIEEEANRLFIYISKIESELALLNSDVTSMSGELVDILASVREIFDSITENIVDVIYGLESGDTVSDKVSEKEIDSVTNGKVFASTNNGRVEGDRNVGGISGAMGLEYSLDPEDDLSPTLSVTQKKQYRLKAVIHASKNYGEVISKYDGAGGITGRMDLGLIYLSEAYGRVESTAGNYVGGIAGIAAGRISACFAKATLAGGSFIGGIVGAGVTESASGGSSSVSGCYTMVIIERAKQYFGAVAGVDRGEYEENRFVSSVLSGIDRVSYGGRAEPIGYEELIKRRYIPDGFYSFTLRFVCDGVVLATVPFEFGESIDPSLFPEIPAKEGHYGRWDRTNLDSLEFDTTVSVVYTPYVITIAGGDRGDGRDLFLVEGEFTEDDSLGIAEGANTGDLTFESGFFTEDSLVESWTLTVPKNNMATNRVHLLPSTDHARIFVRTAEGWRQVDATEFGSYLTFDVSGETVEIAVVRHTVRILPIAIISAVLLLLAAAVVVTVIIRKKKKA